MTASDWGDIYKEIEATPIINAIGSVTLLGGSTPNPEVKEAMERANSAYIPLEHLEEKAGQAIADFVGVPAAYITSGGGSALTLATAAFIAGDDDDKIQRLPDTTGMKNEILIQTRQRYWYDRCLEMAGGKLVDFGTEEEVTQDDLANAIGPNTAVVHYVSYEQNPVDPHALTLDQTIEVAKDNGVPVMVDAAGQIYPARKPGQVRQGRGRHLLRCGEVHGRTALDRIRARHGGRHPQAGAPVFRLVRGPAHPRHWQAAQGRPRRDDGCRGGRQALDDHEPRDAAGPCRTAEPDHPEASAGHSGRNAPSWSTT